FFPFSAHFEILLRCRSPRARGPGDVPRAAVEEFAVPLESACTGLWTLGGAHATLENESRRLDVFGIFGEPLEAREHRFVDHRFVENGTAEVERLLVSAAGGERFPHLDERELALPASEM